MRTSCVERGKIMIRKTNSITGFLRGGSIIVASSFALGLSALAGNMDLPGQNMISSNALQPGGTTEQTQTDSQTAPQPADQAKLRRVSVTTCWQGPGLPWVILTATVTPTTCFETAARFKRRSGISTIMFLSAALSGQASESAGASMVSRISIETRIRITHCSIPVLIKQRFGICQGQRASQPRLGQPFLMAGN